MLQFCMLTKLSLMHFMLLKQFKKIGFVMKIIIAYIHFFLFSERNRAGREWEKTFLFPIDSKFQEILHLFFQVIVCRVMV